VHTERYGQGHTGGPHGLEPGYVLEMSDGEIVEVIVIITPSHYVWRRRRWYHYPWRSLKGLLKFMLGLN
jgi:hypothetical protein